MSDADSNTDDNTDAPAGTGGCWVVIAERLERAAAAVRAGVADDAARIDRIRLFAELEATVAAASVLDAVEFEVSQVALQESQGVSKRERGRGIADQLGYATKTSPATASRRLADARVLVFEMPHTLDALVHGRICPFGAVIAVRETRCLTREDRGIVDAELAPVVETMSIRQIEHAVRARVIDLDQDAMVRRIQRARDDRYVSSRAAADQMATLTALLPVEQGVAVYASLLKAAESARAAGDERTKAQLMADVLVERATGQTSATAVPVEIQLVMTSDTLLGRSDEPAQIPGYGPMPGNVARRIVTGDPDADQARTWVRRLLTDPIDGTVTSIDTKRRRFDGPLRAFIRARDQVCRDPSCDAPIRDIDHLHDWAEGGPTSADNGVGLCQRGNLVDQIPGWTTTGTARNRTVTTPTGHRYQTRPPPALGPRLETQSAAAAETARSG